MAMRIDIHTGVDIAALAALGEISATMRRGADAREGSNPAQSQRRFFSAGMDNGLIERVGTQVIRGVRSEADG